MASYPGARKRLVITVKNETVTPAVLADPTTLTITWGPLGGTTTTKSYPTDGVVVHDSTGTFHIDIDCATAGSYFAHVTSTGVVGSSLAEWIIDPSPV